MKIVITQLSAPPPMQSTVATGIVAATGGQVLATALAGRINLVETVPAGAAVRIGVVGGNYRQEVLNRGGRDLVIYPPVGQAFDGHAVNASVIIPDTGGAVFTFNGVSTWFIS